MQIAESDQLRKSKFQESVNIYCEIKFIEGGEEGTLGCAGIKHLERESDPGWDYQRTTQPVSETLPVPRPEVRMTSYPPGGMSLMNPCSEYSYSLQPV